MARNKRNSEIYEQVEISSIAAEGKSIVRINDLVVFVTNVIPGDIIDLKITRKKKNYCEGVAYRFHKYSELRINPECEHFGVCGGCKWQNLNYETQLYWKQRQVVDALQRIAKVSTENILPILGSERKFYFRNKLEYTFSCIRWYSGDEIKIPDELKNPNAFGFHVPGMFDKILDIKHCLLMDEPQNQIRLAVKKFALENNYEFYNLRKKEGYLRNMVIRNTTCNEWMVILIFNYEDKNKQEKILNFMTESFPQITSLFYIINPKKNDVYTDLEAKLYKGKDHIIEQMEDLRFKIGPLSFFQTNTYQAHRLYQITREFAQLTGNETVYDLYTGTGTIANFIASKAKKVVGIEYIKSAIDDAVVNSEINNIKNTIFYSGDIKNILTDEFFSEHGKPDIVITDPPRAGMHEDVVKTILRANPEKIVYVSCNPATQARDIEIFSTNYLVEKIQPVDMFPQTHHVENIVLLVRKTKQA